MNLNEVKTLIIGTVKAAFQNKKTLDKFDGSSGTLKYNGVPVNNVPVFVADDSPVGSVIGYSGLDVPQDYLVCDGSVYNIIDYPLLAHHILTAFGSVNYFGGDGVNTFAVPNFAKEYETFSPKMTSNTTPAPYKITASSQYGSGYEAYRAFNNNTGDLWCSTQNNIPAWIKIDFGSQKSFCFVQIVSGHESYTPLGIIIKGSNDGVNYEELATYNVSSWPENTARNIYFNKTLYYRYVQIFITKTNGNYCEIGEVKFGKILKTQCIKYQITQNNISKDMVNYSLEEQVIGSWINGKPLYQKTIVGTIPAWNSNFATFTTIEELDTLVQYHGFYINADDKISIPYVNMLNTGKNYFISMFQRGNTIKIAFAENLTAVVGKTAYVTIQYTKTTDAENSFTPDMLSNISTLNTTASDEEVNEVIGGI